LPGRCCANGQKKPLFQVTDLSRLLSVDRSALPLRERPFRIQRANTQKAPSGATQEQDMKKTFVAMVAVATVAGSLSATPAHAQRGVAAGVAAGLIGGAIVGGAIAASRPAYGYPAPAYVEEGPYPACRMVRERFWDGYGWRVRRYEVCN
jgi:hypothetical protein